MSVPINAKAVCEHDISGLHTAFFFNYYEFI